MLEHHGKTIPSTQTILDTGFISPTRLSATINRIKVDPLPVLRGDMNQGSKNTKGQKEGANVPPPRSVMRPSTALPCACLHALANLLAASTRQQVSVGERMQAQEGRRQERTTVMRYATEVVRKAPLIIESYVQSGGDVDIGPFEAI